MKKPLEIKQPKDCRSHSDDNDAFGLFWLTVMMVTIIAFMIFCALLQP